jgi:phage-related protein
VVEKPVSWLGSSLDDLRAFAEDAAARLGTSSAVCSRGLMPSDWKPMGTVGPGTYEIRIHTSVEHRVFYVAKFEEAVYVLHAFRKRTRQTPQADITLARTRYADLVRRRAKTKRESS